MPDSPDHRVDMFRVATERRAAGKPVWAYRVEHKFTGDESFEEKRDTCVRIVRASAWFKADTEGDEFGESELALAVEELSDTDTEKYFNTVWEAIYDMADADRCWLYVQFNS